MNRFRVWAPTVVLGLTVVLGTLTLGAGPADSLPNPFASCPNPAPAVSMPGTGVSGSLAGTPPAGWKTAPATDIWGTYGTPMRFYVAHPGCAVGNIPNVNAEAHISTWTGNLFLGAAEVLVNLGAALHSLITSPTWITMFSGIQQSVAGQLGQSVWWPFVGASLLIVAIGIMVRHRAGHVAGAFDRFAWAMAVVVMVVASITAGTAIAVDVAQGELGVISAVQGGMTGNVDTAGSAADLETQAILYPAWVRGTLGSDTSTTAQRYGLTLLDGSSYTWAEHEAGRTDAAAATAKAKEWNAAQAAIKSADPSAYDTMTGSDMSRAGTGIEAWIGTLITVPFAALCDSLIGISVLAVIVLLSVFPLVAIFGIHRRNDRLIIGQVVAVGGLAGTAVVAAAMSAFETETAGYLFAHVSWWEAWFFLFLLFPTIGYLWWRARRHAKGKTSRRERRRDERQDRQARQRDQRRGPWRAYRDTKAEIRTRAVSGARDFGAGTGRDAVRKVRARQARERVNGAQNPELVDAQSAAGGGVVGRGGRGGVGVGGSRGKPPSAAAAGRGVRSSAVDNRGVGGPAATGRVRPDDRPSASSAPRRRPVRAAHDTAARAAGTVTGAGSVPPVRRRVGQPQTSVAVGRGDAPVRRPRPPRRDVDGVAG